MLAGIFVLFWIAIIARAAQLEWRYGASFRAEALKPLRREIVLPAVRGRILARDGTPIAADVRLLALAVHYRYLQQTPDEAWLRQQARLQLPRSQRRIRERMDPAINRLRSQLTDLNRRLARLSGLTTEAWDARVARIENRVEMLSASVNQRRWERFQNERLEPRPEPTSARAPWWNVAANLPDALRALGTPEEAGWEGVIVKEQVDYHIVVENLPRHVADEIRDHADRYPGVRVLEVPRRTYPGGKLAANVVGHLGKEAGSPLRAPELRRKGANEQPPGETPTQPAPDAWMGVLGLEHVCESSLAGRSGDAVENTDRRGQLISTTTLRPASHGRDVRLTLDLPCQQAAEALLDRALLCNRHARGGAIVVLDIEDGDLLALASAPRFDPNAFALANNDAIHKSLTDAGRPMFDRACRMALPPGELAQPFIAVAMLESNRVPAQAAFPCEGFLRDPDGLCCKIYRRQGVGHGEVTLSQAIACNCTVFFSRYAGVTGIDAMLEQAVRFGFRSATGIELDKVARGSLPKPIAPAKGAPREYEMGEAQLLALGQGSFTATPLQLARAMAAIASGGRLPTPRLVRGGASASPAVPAVAGTGSLAVVRDALYHAVADDEGAGHDALAIDGVSIAGLAATGEVSGQQADHAWCAGYVPAEAPRIAFAVALEHGGEGTKAAAPIARRLVQRLIQLGWIDDSLAAKNGAEAR